RTPGHQMPRCEEFIRSRRAAEAGNPEKRCQGFWIAERGIDRGYADIDFLLDSSLRQTLEAEGMILAVGADGVAFIVHAADHGGVVARHLADQEIGDFHALRSQRIEDGVAVRRYR